MMKKLDNILELALARKPSRLSFETTYDHTNLFDWLQTFLPDWTILKPEKSCALSDWPSEITRNEVKIWLEEKNYPDPDDLINGACEPLAYYLSSSISKIDFDKLLSLETLSEQKEFVFSVFTQVKIGLDELDARIAAETIFGAYIQQKIPSPKFWPAITEGSWNHFLFGHQLAKDRIQDVVSSCGDGTTIIPLYVLCYIFDEDELTTSQLRNTKEETAQYSLHSVGLVINRSTKTIIVADPNGDLNKGSSIEFLSMPLTKLNRKATTSVSRSDTEKEGFIVATKDGSKKRTRLHEKI